MKKLLIFSFVLISIFTLSGCQQKQTLDENDVKAFVKEFKGITHNVKVGEKDNAVALKETKPYLDEEWYKINERDRQVNYPFNFAEDSKNDVSLTDVKIDSIEENKDGDGYKVKYTLNLSIGEEKENVEKSGEMIIIEDGSKGFLITYDKEVMITFDKIKFL